MEDSKPSPSPFQSRVKIVATCTYIDINATLYRQLVGIFLYITHTHPDISFIVGLVSQYMKTPHESHWKETKRILQYVQGIVHYRIHYILGVTPLLVGFIDSD
jgi:hypothetical protein